MRVASLFREWDCVGALLGRSAQIVCPLLEQTRVRQYPPAVTAIKISALPPGSDTHLQIRRAHRSAATWVDVIETGIIIQKYRHQGKTAEFSVKVTLKLDRWSWKTIGRAPLLSHLKLWASIGSHIWINILFGPLCVTLTFRLWPWPFAWTSLLPKVIIPWNLMVILWQNHCECVMDRDRQTNVWTGLFIKLLGRS